MFPNQRHFRGLLFVLSFLVSACRPAGGDQQAGTEPSSSDSLNTSTNTPATFDPLDEVIGLHEQWTGDLDGMIARRRIRALVPYSRTSYYIDGTERRGLAYEAMTYFEQDLNRRLGREAAADYVHVVFIPVTRDRLLPALLEGYGDIVAANLTITPQRKEKVRFSTPVLSGAREVVVTGPAAPALAGLGDLPGQTVHLRASSSFFEHIQLFNDSLQRAGRPVVRVEKVDEHLEDEDILEMVNAGLLPMTILDEHKSRFWAQVLDSIQVREDLAVYTGGEIAWAMRPASSRLKEMVDAFIEENKKGKLLGNLLFNRYLKNTGYVQNAFTPEDRARFKATRDYFIRYGEQYQFDWLMLAAQGFQESRLNQDLVSPAGAVGVMQIKPSTAGDPNVGIPDVYELENNIHAGTKYLRFIVDRYFVDPAIDSLNAGLFAMAAYNAGPARVQQLRKEAASHGLDPNVWFNNVEIIAAREVGREPVQYVSNIFKYYTSYRSLSRYVQETGKDPFEDW